MSADIPLGKYRHYKGEYYYDVYGFACNSDNDGKMVLYRPLYPIPELEAEYPNGIIFARDIEIFTSTVNINGVETPRFQLVEAA